MPKGRRKQLRALLNVRKPSPPFVGEPLLKALGKESARLRKEAKKQQREERKNRHPQDDVVVTAEEQIELLRQDYAKGLKRRMHEYKMQKQKVAKEMRKAAKQAQRDAAAVAQRAATTSSEDGGVLLSVEGDGVHRSSKDGTARQEVETSQAVPQYQPLQRRAGFPIAEDHVAPIVSQADDSHTATQVSASLDDTQPPPSADPKLGKHARRKQRLRAQKEALASVEQQDRASSSSADPNASVERSSALPADVPNYETSNLPLSFSQLAIDWNLPRSQYGFRQGPQSFPHANNLSWMASNTFPLNSLFSMGQYTP